MSNMNKSELNMIMSFIYFNLVCYKSCMLLTSLRTVMSGLILFNPFFR